MEDAVRLSSRFLLAAALVLALFDPPGSRNTRSLAIGRDGDPTNPIKILQRIVAWALDELEIPKP
jgi:hypothetical protein